MINYTYLYQYFDRNTINILIEQASTDIDDNIHTIQLGLDHKIIYNLHKGSHSIKSMAFIGLNNIMKLATELTDITREKTYEETDIKKYIHIFQQLKKENTIFKQWKIKYNRNN